MTKLTTKNEVQQATNAVNIIPTTLTALRSVLTTVPVVQYDDLVEFVGRRPAQFGTADVLDSRNTCGVWNDGTDSTSAIVDTAVMGRSLSVSDGT